MKMKKKRVEELLAIAREKKRALIMPHNYADPDAMAAALAIKTLFKKKLKLPSIISFGGGVGRNENRVMCECLNIEITPFKDIDMEDYDLYVLVDCQPSTGNNSFPEDLTAHIIIDHHPPEGVLEGVSFVELREDVGSSSTIVTEYLIDAGVRMDKNLASALLYGIKTDCLNFTRKTREDDLKAYLYLFRFADLEKISLIEGAGLPKEYFKSLNGAVEDAGTYDDVLVSDLGDLSNPGAIGEFADMFLRLEGVNTILCFGVHDDTLLISVRSLKPGVHAGKVIRYAVGKRGTAGGHETMAGGQIRLHTETKKEEDEHKKAVIGRVFNRLGIEGKRKRKIV